MGEGEEGGGSGGGGGGSEQEAGGGQDQIINAIFCRNAAELYSWSKATVSFQ